MIVEDDTLLNTTLAYHMQGRGMETDSAFGCMDARKKLEARSYDLVILDVALPDGSGYDLCRKIRETSRVPVMFLTAADEETDIIMGLDIGGEAWYEAHTICDRRGWRRR